MEGKAEVFQLLLTRLHDAAIEGNVPSLINLLRIDPFILDRCIIQKSDCFMQSPLHIATNMGHLDFTKEILSRKPELAEELDQFKRWSPLHLASAKGYLEIVKALLVVNPNMCFTLDQDGRNPFHIAAINGQLYVLVELLRAKPQVAMQRTKDGETVLHLCVIHSQLQALELLANVTDDSELLNSKNGDGNTVLHLAVAAKQPQMVKFLLKHKKMERNAINTNGSTAMDVILKSRKDVNDKEIKQSLKRAKGLRAKDVLKPHKREHQARITYYRKALMVVASLIATMAFQVGINPPGGTWQDIGDDDHHVAGHSILADLNTNTYERLIMASSIALISSLSVILLLISGLPCRRLFVAILVLSMWIAITAIAFTYASSITSVGIAAKLKKIDDLHNGIFLYINERRLLSQSVDMIIYGWLIFIIMLLLTHFIRFIVKLIKTVVRIVVRAGKKLYRMCFPRAATTIRLPV